MNELLNFIFNKLCDNYKNDIQLIYKIIDITVECDRLLKNGNKDCIHLEYYIVSLIELISEYKNIKK